MLLEHFDDLKEIYQKLKTQKILQERFATMELFNKLSEVKENLDTILIDCDKMLKKTKVDIQVVGAPSAIVAHDPGLREGILTDSQRNILIRMNPQKAS